QDCGAGDHIRLLEIIGGHLPAPAREASFETRNNFRIAVEFQSQRVGYCFAGEIIFCWPQAAHEDHDVGARQSQGCRSSEMFTAVANDSLENDFYAKLVKPFGEIER